jgi:hypothetical protein
MIYEDFVKAYCPDLELIDMLDWLQNITGTEGNPIPQAFDSKETRTDEELLR